MPQAAEKSGRDGPRGEATLRQLLDLASRYSSDPWPLVAGFARALLLDWSPGDRTARAELLKRLQPQLLQKPQDLLEMLTQRIWLYLRPRESEGQLEAWLELAGAACAGPRPSRPADYFRFIPFLSPCHFFCTSVLFLLQS